MIVVNVTKNGITVEGHAGYAETGKDIVCSSVSTLTQNLIHAIKALTSDNISYKTFPGHADIGYKNLSEQGKLLVDSFFIGISDVALTYPDYVQIGTAADGR